MGKLTGLLQREWSDEALRVLQGVPRPVVLAFSLAFAINVVCFFYHMAQFPMGDHDALYPGAIPLLSELYNGRWFVPFLNLLRGHAMVPVWPHLLTFCAMIAAGMGAVLLWRPGTGFLPLLAGGVLVSCMPNMTEAYYFFAMADKLAVAQLFMVLALHAAYRVPNKDGLSIVSWPRLIASVILIVCGVATYQPSITTWAVLFCGLCIMEALRPGAGEADTLLTRLLALAVPLGTFLVAGILYNISLKLYPLMGYSPDAIYQVQTIGLRGLLSRILEVIEAAYIHLWRIEPFMNVGLKALLLLVCLGGAAVLLHQAEPRPLKMLLALALILLMPVAAKAQFFISSSTDYYAFRFAIFGLNYMYLFFLLSLLCSGLVLARNAGFILCLALLPTMLIGSLTAQANLVRSNQHDIATLNRVVARLEALPDFDPDKRYNLVQFGSIKPYVPEFHRDIYDESWIRLSKGRYARERLKAYYSANSGSHIFHGAINSWSPGNALKLVNSYLKLDTHLSSSFVAHHPELVRKALYFVEGKEPFPAPGSVGIVDDTIVLFFDSRATESARRSLEDR